MNYRLAVDTGGTFTDVVVADDAGNLALGKALTTPGRIFEAMQEALRSPAEEMGLNVSSLLEASDLFIYGTTAATNAILEGKTARTAFLVTEGFPDVLVLREGGKFNAFDFATQYPEPYIPRRLTFEIRERISSEGAIVIPLDEDQAKQVVRSLAAKNVEAVAVCLLWATANPTHEDSLGELIEKELPGVPYTLSHRLNPIVREYRRASSTAIDASLKPLIQGHLREMERDLRGAGFEGEILAATSVGGAMHVEDLVERPIYSVRSGPAMAPVAAKTYAQGEAGVGEVIVCDTGGTSFDVSLVRDGMVKFTRETWLGRQFSGHLTGLSSVDVRSIGAGGGSIAWLDSGGLLRVGPQSAGANPGPACYGKGGDGPTVTDAALILGYIDAEYFLGGRMGLDVSAARRVIERLGDHIGESVERTASAILAVANEHMVRAIQEITVNEGVDPRESFVVAGGGAAGLNVVPIVRELGCSQVLIPRTAGALSACGIQYSDVVAEFSTSKFARTTDFAYEEVNETLKNLEASIEEFADRLRARGMNRFEVNYFVEARYAYQVWELEVALAKGRFDDVTDLEKMAVDFHDVHERVFAVKEPGAEIECLYWKGRLTAFLDGIELKSNELVNTKPSPLTRRRAFFAEIGEVEIPIYLGESLLPGMKVEGPAVIEEPTTTIVVYPSSVSTVTPLNNYLLEVR